MILMFGDSGIGIADRGFANQAFANEGYTKEAFSREVLAKDDLAQPGVVERELLRLDVERLYKQQAYLAIVELLGSAGKHELMSAGLWLRLGNCLDHLARHEDALTAYRHAQAIALPAPSQHGYLQAKLVRSKALLNMAQIYQRLSKQALSEFQANAMPVAELNDALASTATHSRALAHALSGADTGLDNVRPRTVGNSAPNGEPNAKSSDSTPVIIEYRRGAVRSRP